MNWFSGSIQIMDISYKPAGKAGYSYKHHVISYVLFVAVQIHFIQHLQEQKPTPPRSSRH